MQITPVGYYGIISIMTEIFLIFTIIGILLYTMNKRSKSFRAVDPRNMRMSTTYIAFILLLIAILAPAYLNVYPQLGFYPEIMVFAMSWQISGNNLTIFMFDPASLLLAFLLMFLKFVFIYQLFKYYYHATTKSRVVTVGIISELQLTLFGLVMVPFTINTPGLAVMLSIPLPLLLLTGLLVLKLIPAPPLLGDWEELEKPKEWWEDKDVKR
jgi:hypothetical protein